MNIPATVYLIHFARPYWHARHYIGYTALEDVDARMARHRAGGGSRLRGKCAVRRRKRIWASPMALGMVAAR